MASQPARRLRGVGPVAAPAVATAGVPAHVDADRWRAYHLFYHQDLDRLLLEMVDPLVTALLAEGRIDRFFFVRYNLGGPHVRLRWRTVGEPATAERSLASAAAAFFARAPSTETLPAEAVHRLNRAVLGVDPLARPDDDVVQPDNSWRAFPVGLEVERYGGASRLAGSLDLFAASSVRALELLGELGSLSAGQAQTRFVVLLVQLAAAFAGSERELYDLAGYGVRFMGSPFQRCVEQAEGLFARRREALTEVVARALAADALRDEPLVDAVRRFAPTIADLEPAKRWRIAASHLHMTANRLGLLNADEVYLSRIAERAVRLLLAARVGRGSPWELADHG